MHWFRRWTWVERLVVGVATAVILSLFIPDLRSYVDQNPDNSVSIETLLPPDQIKSGSAESVQVVLTGHSIGSDGSRTQQCLLINAGSTPIRYHGYSPDSFGPRLPVGRIEPIYQQQVLEQSQWKDVEIKRCGVGMAEMRLMPGQAGRFNVYQKAAEPVTRIGVYYTDVTKGPTAVGVMVWSKPFPTK